MAWLPASALHLDEAAQPLQKPCRIEDHVLSVLRELVQSKQLLQLFPQVLYGRQRLLRQTSHSQQERLQELGILDARIIAFLLFGIRVKQALCIPQPIPETLARIPLQVHGVEVHSGPLSSHFFFPLPVLPISWHGFHVSNAALTHTLIYARRTTESPHELTKAHRVDVEC